MSRDALKTLYHPFAAGLLDLPGEGQRFLFLGAEAGQRLPEGFAAGIDSVQPLRPLYRALEAARASVTPTIEGEGYDGALVHLHRADVTRMARLIEATQPLLRPGGTIAVFVDHPNAEMDPNNFSGELAQYIEDLLPADWIGSSVSARFAGGRIKRRLRRLERRILNHLMPTSWTRLPLLVGAVVLRQGRMSARTAVHGRISLEA